MFDFTSLFQAENSSRFLERKGKRLLLALIGDSLLEVTHSCSINQLWRIDLIIFIIFKSHFGPWALVLVMVFLPRSTQHG
jgi:hypothetical protein